MLGLLGAIVNPHAGRALAIGLGTGSTAGWLGAIPAMERVDVVELEPLVVEVARACEPVNRDVLHNPKVHVAIGDARERLLTSVDEYDVIASEPSNPFRAGVASLFTREYYRAASDRLSADGVFVQWLQAYEIDARTLRTVYATMGSVFPHVETWQLGRSDFALLAAKRPLTYGASALAARIREEPFKTALGVTWRADVLRPAKIESRAQADEQGRRLALVDYYEGGNLAAARQHWPAAASARDPTELAMLADLAADAGAADEAASLASIDRLRAFQ